MSENRESILANFQAITAIEDIALAIYHLESNNWDLEAAVHLAIPQEQPQVPFHTNNISMEDQSNIHSSPHISPPPPPLNTNPIVWEIPTLAQRMIDNPGTPINYTGFTEEVNDFTEPSTSSRSTVNSVLSPMMISEPQEETFHVNFNNVVHKITISNLKTINDLKSKIFDSTKVPICRQQLRGWSLITHKEAQCLTTILRTLKLSRDNNLFLTDLSEEGFVDDIDVVVVPSDPPVYQLHIKVANENDRIIPLNFPGIRTILEVKSDMYTITSIPVRHQIWIGWPPHVSNSTRLMDSGIDVNHCLELRRSEEVPSASSNRSRRHSGIHDMDSDSSVEEFEDASEDLNVEDDIFSEAPATSRIKHLIDDHCDEEIIGCLQFIENYKERYGQGPNFFEGNLENALKTACSKQAKDRKMLAIYLHHDRSVLSNVFCGQLLNNENIIKLISDNYVIFGWDLTCESNKNLFLSSLTACVGDTASIQIRSTAVNQLPAIMIIRKMRSTYEVFDVIHGNINRDELYIHLMMNTDQYHEQLKVEIREEQERAERENVKNEQDAAYQESLEADRAKEAAKQRKEKMMATERQRLESERAESEAKRDAIMRAAESTLPPEPAIGGENVTKIRFRKPTGEFFERRFIVDTELRILLNFATANGFLVEEYKIISSFPRRDLTSMNPNDTLKSLKLFPQETVMLEER